MNRIFIDITVVIAILIELLLFPIRGFFTIYRLCIGIQLRLRNIIEYFGMNIAIVCEADCSSESCTEKV